MKHAQKLDCGTYEISTLCSSKNEYREGKVPSGTFKHDIRYSKEGKEYISLGHFYSAYVQYKGAKYTQGKSTYVLDIDSLLPLSGNYHASEILQTIYHLTPDFVDFLVFIVPQEYEDMRALLLQEGARNIDIPDGVELSMTNKDYKQYILDNWHLSLTMIPSFDKD